MVAGDANLTEGELAKVDVGCFVQCSSPKRASKESSPSFLGVRTSRNPKQVLLLARGWPTQALGTIVYPCSETSRTAVRGGEL